MKTKKVVLSIFVFTLMLLSYHCSDVDGSYDNPSDPESGKYVPNSPTSLAISVSSDTLVLLSWKDVSLGEKGFLIERKNGVNGTYSLLAKVPANVVNYADHIILQKGVLYYYRVSAYSDNANSYNTSENFFTFSMSTPTKPVITSKSNNSFRIDWNDNDLAQSGYKLEKAVNGNQFYQIASLDKYTKYYVDNDIDTLNSYSYRVKAFASNNESDYSNVVQAEYGFYGLTLQNTLNLGSPVHSLVYSSDGSKFAAMGMSYYLNIWNTKDGSLIQNFTKTGSGVASAGWPFQMAFSPDGKYIAGNASNMGVNVWNIQTGSLTSSLSLPYDARSLCFSSDSKSIFTGNFSGRIAGWKLQTKTDWMGVNSNNSSDVVSFLYLTKAGSKLISCYYNPYGSVGVGTQIWSTSSWSEIASFAGYQAQNFSISQDEKYLISGNNMLSASDGSFVTSFSAPVDGKICLTYDDKYFVGKSYSGTLVLGRVSDGKIMFSISTPSPDIYTYPALATSPGSYTFIAAGGSTGEVDVWSIARQWVTY